MTTKTLCPYIKNYPEGEPICTFRRSPTVCIGKKCPMFEEE